MTTEEIILRYLPAEEGFGAALAEAMNYSVKAGGKRLRPRLMQETCGLFGGSPALGPFMAAMEMIHTYSLVHDDLPAMDNDVLRRGRTTTWKKYGEARGILAGDALLTWAFQTAAGAYETGAVPALCSRALQILAEKAGLNGMCGGQDMDVAMEGQEISAELLDYIYRNKTGALIEASMMIGAVLGGASEEQIACCGRIGLALGLAFQIRDDILDVTGTEETLGKPIGSDEKNGKRTYAAIHGLEAAQQQVEALTAEALAALDTLPGDKTVLREMITGMVNRNS